MIIWLASYPKSGNTFLRSFLSTYFFSKDTKFNFELLSNIRQYPNTKVFSKLGVNVYNPSEIAKSHLQVQSYINQDSKKFQFLKTHSGFLKMDGNSFTDLKNTLGVIYIVRDPRDVVISYAHHNNQTHDQTSKMITDNYILDGESKGIVPVYMGSWSLNYNSWKQFKDFNKYLLIKYEDLIKDKKGNFKKILYFIKNITKTNLEIDDDKIEKTITEIDFEKLKKLEKKVGFMEAKEDDKGNKINFFRKGVSNQWRESLDKKIQKSIETICEKEMKELGYL